MNDTILVNEAINFKEALIINNGEKLGVMPIKIALEKARLENMDLVCVSSDGMPVCKIMNYGKYRFEQQKKTKAMKKNSKTIETSEVQISLSIEKHDLDTKVKMAKRLIENKGNNVLVVLRLRGREVSQTENAILKIREFASLCDSFSKVKKEPSINGKDVQLILEKL